MDSKEVEATISVRAWKDPSFKKKLLSDPREALKSIGIKNIPAVLDIQVMEQKKNTWYINLKEPPRNARELSEEELTKLMVAGETSDDWW